MRKFLLIAALLLPAFISRAQEADSIKYVRDIFSLPDVITEDYLDTVNVQKQFLINDYWIVGAHFGGTLVGSSFNPSRETNYFFKYPYYGISITKFFTMLNTFRNLGLEFGVQHTWEGYQFKENKETHVIQTMEGATKALMEVYEANFLTHAHFDFTDKVKMILKIGLYGGYRMNIVRYGDRVPDEIRTSFLPTDHRWTYGVEGGGGFGLMFDPIEIHVNALLKWSWSTLYDPNYQSPYFPRLYPEYYYRFAYPFDIMLSIGLYYQLTPRYGRTRGQLRREAKRIVYGERK